MLIISPVLPVSEVLWTLAWVFDRVHSSVLGFLSCCEAPVALCGTAPGSADA
jgi:hypothetical protein